MAITDRLMVKVGPLPAIAWAGIAGGAYVLYSYATRSKGEPVSDTEYVDGSVGMPVGDIGGADDFTYGYGNATGPYRVDAGTVTVTDPADDGIMDLETWAQRAVNHLIGNGYSVTDATTAIWNYINDSPDDLSGTQMNAWQEAIKKFGLPPGSLDLSTPTLRPETQPDTTTPNIPDTPKPKPTAPKPPTQKQQWRGVVTRYIDGKDAWFGPWRDTSQQAVVDAKNQISVYVKNGRKQSDFSYRIDHRAKP